MIAVGCIEGDSPGTPDAVLDVLDRHLAGASLAPALHVLRRSPASALRASGGGQAAGRLRATLVVGQVGMSVVLVLVTGLFVRALVEGLGADPGFDADRVAIFGLTLDEDVGEGEGRVLQQSVAAATRTPSPDIAAVSLTASAPVGVARSPLTFQIPGRTPPPGQDGFIVDAKTVGSGYFNTVGVPLQSGRDFTDSDDREMSRVAVVTQAFVDLYWPGEDPVGRTVTVSGEAVRVVGVAQDTNYLVQDPTPDPLLYLSMAGRYLPQLLVMYRTVGLAGDVRSAVQRAVVAVTPGSTVIEPLTTREMLRRALLPQQLGVVMIGAMGVVALILAMIGLYGLVQHSVTCERRELGIRLALGGSSAHVLATVLQKGLAYVGVGTILGVGASLALGPLLRSVLVGANPRDPSTYAVVVLSFGAVALIAALIPARRAIHIDPAEALRAE